MVENDDCNDNDDGADDDGDSVFNAYFLYVRHCSEGIAHLNLIITLWGEYYANRHLGVVRKASLRR